MFQAELVLEYETVSAKRMKFSHQHFNLDLEDVEGRTGYGIIFPELRAIKADMSVIAKHEFTTNKPCSLNYQCCHFNLFAENKELIMIYTKIYLRKVTWMTPN